MVAVVLYSTVALTTKFRECGFCLSDPAAWNSLLSNVHNVNDTTAFKNDCCNLVSKQM